MSQDIWADASLITNKTEEGKGVGSAGLQLLGIGGVHSGKKGMKWYNRTYMSWVYSMTIYRRTRAVHRERIGSGRFEMKISLQNTEVRLAYGMSEVGVAVNQQ